MVARRLTPITPSAATPDQLWQRVEAAWSTVPQEHIQSLFESIQSAGLPIGQLGWVSMGPVLKKPGLVGLEPDFPSICQA
ncbi:hypothetical protein TNCV_2095271 [Trichonephila clavipes]|nr:hypothetical protein TNCV_2095271 [Trichonephila clavipes]